eukprot:GHVU01093148.1.p1 GENE.GHVU01093148.1~~GHVU01093148.1.p1  ORF type:complete len:286 (+),score=53.84 GHVU01093148.1:760-1617(+)
MSDNEMPKSDSNPSAGADNAGVANEEESAEEANQEQSHAPQTCEEGDQESGERPGPAEPENGDESNSTENPAHVKEAVDSNIADALVGMGFNRISVEKALYFKGGGNVEMAVTWLEEHADDEDLNTPLRPDLDAPKASSAASKLITPEEREAKALELQRKYTERRAEQEKQHQIQQEKDRKERTKKTLETQRANEEVQRKRFIEDHQREKKKHEEERRRQETLLQNEWRERFGDSVPYPTESPAAAPKTGKDAVRTANVVVTAICTKAMKICDRRLKRYSANVRG